MLTSRLMKKFNQSFDTEPPSIEKFHFSALMSTAMGMEGSDTPGSEMCYFQTWGSRRWRSLLVSPGCSWRILLHCYAGSSRELPEQTGLTNNCCEVDDGTVISCLMLSATRSKLN